MRIKVSEIKKAGGLKKWIKSKGKLPENKRIGFAENRMNGLEKRYADFLEFKKENGDIALWRFEEIKLRLADNTFYTPDFLVITKDGSLELHETKGFMRDDASVKIKVAAEKFPEFTFFLIQEKNGNFVFKKY